jgi:hypothetical protein
MTIELILIGILRGDSSSDNKRTVMANTTIQSNNQRKGYQAGNENEGTLYQPHLRLPTVQNVQPNHQKSEYAQSYGPSETPLSVAPTTILGNQFKANANEPHGVNGASNQAYGQHNSSSALLGAQCRQVRNPGTIPIQSCQPIVSDQKIGYSSDTYMTGMKRSNNGLIE